MLVCKHFISRTLWAFNFFGRGSTDFTKFQKGSIISFNVEDRGLNNTIHPVFTLLPSLMDISDVIIQARSMTGFAVFLFCNRCDCKCLWPLQVFEFCLLHNCLVLHYLVSFIYDFSLRPSPNLQKYGWGYKCVCVCVWIGWDSEWASFLP